MLSGTGKSGRAVLKSALASFLALLAFVMCAPQLAFADETTQAINGTMTITLQDGGASGAGASALGKASSGTVTGDALIWLILGVVVLIAGAVYVFIKSRRLATNAGTSAGALSSVSADINASSKKKTIIVAIVTALIACTCFGMFASKGVAFANKGTAVTNDTFSSIFGSSAVVVDNDGNVLSNSISVINNEDEAIIVKSIEAPSTLSDWNADITDKTIESGKATEGTWDGATIPTSVLEQVKNNNGYLELSFTMNVTDAKTTLNFDKFVVDTKDQTYTGEKFEPSVTCDTYKLGTDYEVAYGENTNAGEDAGTITIKGIGDYKGEQIYTFTINKAPLNKSLTLTTVSVEETYDGNPLSAKEATASGLPEGNVVKLEYSLDGTSWTEDASSLSITNVSESTTVQIRATSDANYEGTVETTAGLTVTEAPLTVTTGSDEKVYDGTALTCDNAEVSGLVNGETLSIRATGSQVEVGSSANTYEITWNGSAKESNYSITKENLGTLEVTQFAGEITVKTTGGTFTYDGTEHKATVDVDGVPAGYKVETAISSASATDVNGDGIEAKADTLVIVNAQIEDVTNELNIKYINDTLKITPAKLTVTTPSAEKVYDGTALTAPATADNLKGLVNNETATVKVSGTQTAVGSSENTYAGIEWGTAKEGNYEVASVTEGTLTVKQSTEEIVVTVTGGEFTYDGTEHKATVSVSTLPKGYVLETATSDAKATDANGEGITANVDHLVIRNAQGEDVTDSLNITRKSDTLKVKPATLTVVTPSASKQYDGKALTSAGTIEGFVNGETATFATTGSQINVGKSTNTYSINWTGTAKEANYTISETLGTLEVTNNTTKIDVTAGSDEKTYDGTALTSNDVTVSGLPEGFSYTTVTEGSQTDAGTGTNTVTEFKILDPSGNDVTEYFTGVEKHTGELKVTQREVTLTSATDSKTYDGTALTNKNVEVTEGSFVGSQSFSATTTGTITNVGSTKNTFDYELTNGATANNYNVTVVEGVLSVSKAPLKESLTLTPEASEKTYDGTALEANKATATGLPEGNVVKIEYSTDGINWTEDPSDLYITNVLESTTVQVRATSSANYEGTVTGTARLTITKRTVELASEGGSKVYDGTALTKPEVTGWEQSDNTGFVTGEVTNVRATGSVTKVEEGTVTNTIAYDTASSFNADNYTITTSEGKLSITKAPLDKNLTLTTTPASKVYDGGALTANAATASALPEGNTVTIEYSTDGINWITNPSDISIINVSDSTTVQVRATSDANYEGTVTASADLTITAQSIEPGTSGYGGVEISTPENVTYDGKEHKWVPTVTDKDENPLKEGTDYTVTYNTDDFTGLGTITVTIAGTGNYTGTVERTYQIIDSEPQAFAVYSASTDGGLLYFFKDTKANIDKAKAAGSYKDVTISDLYEGIEDFDSSEKAPWYKHSNSITSVTVVDEGIAPTSTENWFNGCANLTSVDLLLLDTFKITTTKFMFAECSKLTWLNLSNFKTSSVRNMSGMFIGCSALTTVGNISEWDTSNVTDMSLMFNSCSKLTTLGAEKIEWKTGSVTDMSNMFYDCKNLKADCSGWTVDNVTKHTYFNENATGVTPPNWKTAFAVYSTDGQLNFYKRATVPTAGETIEVQPGTTQTVAAVYDGFDTKTYTSVGEVPWYGIRDQIETVNFVDEGIQPESTAYWFSSCGSLTHVNGLSKLDTSQTKTMRSMFSFCRSLTALSGMAKWKTSEVTNMYGLFVYCDSLATIDDVSNWDTSKVTDMESLFDGCSNLTKLDVSSWNVSNVTNMGNLFYDCSSLKELDVSSWKVSSVTNMSYLFRGCSSLTELNVSSWDVSSVTIMYYMFTGCTSLSSVGDLSAWNTKTSNVEDVNAMFDSCSSLKELDVSSWDVSSVTNMGYLFRGCSSLKELDVSSWKVSSVTDMKYMFSECTSLSSVGDLSAWNTRTSNVQNMRSMFYNCSKLMVDCSGWNVGNVTYHDMFKTNAKDIKEPNWPDQVAAASVASNNSLSALATASVVAGDKTSAVSTASDNTSAVAQNADGNGTINSEETATTEADSTEGANEVAGEVSSTAESDAVLQEVNCLSALSKENSSEAEMKAVA